MHFVQVRFKLEFTLIMLVKNQVYEAVICDYTAQGQGIAKIEGCAVFVPNGIVGEKCTVRIEK